MSSLCKSGRIKSWIVAGVAVGGTLVLLLVPLPSRWHGQWQGRFFDLGHVPLFAVLTLLLWPGLGDSWRWPVIVSLTLAALAELVQGYFDRSASFADFVRGALGVGIAAVIVNAWRGPRNIRRLAGHGLVILGLCAWPVADLGPYLLDAYEGWRAFPVLAEFRTSRETLRWECQQARLQRIPDSEQPDTWCGRLELLPGPAEYPGAALEPIIRDFSAFHRLCWLISTPSARQNLVFSVRSGRDGSSPSNHYQFGQTFSAGEHQVVIDLAGVAPRAQPGTLDLSNIVQVQVFTIRPQKAEILCIKRIWLE